MNTSEWIKFFPYKTPRKEQEDFINFALESFKTHRFVIGSCPTGSGKSAIAITIARYLQQKYINDNNTKTAYITTTQKILQDQYVKDFPWIANVTAKSNYECRDRYGISCEFGLTMAKLIKDKVTRTEYMKNCVYFLARKNFIDSDISLTNVPYLLNSVEYTPDISMRKLLVVDECHNLEQAIVDYVSMDFSKYLCEEHMSIKWPINIQKMTITQFTHWISSVYLPKMETELKKAESTIKSNPNEEFLASKAGMSIMRKYNLLEKQVNGIKAMLERFSVNEWVFTVSPTGDTANLKPIYASKYVHNCLFKIGEKVLLMSGTIGEKNFFCKNLGIDPKNATFMSIDSTFPVDNRPIYKMFAGSMSKKNIQDTLPILVEYIKGILEQHQNEKGIIHTVSYSTAQYIIDNIKSNRLLLHDSRDRMDVLNFHKQTSDPTVLISPSFTEGVDLVGDLSRFQVLCKIPFPYLADNYIKIKMDKVPDWYNYQTAKTIIQALGRSVRSETDHAISYILDSDWNFFFARNSKMFPKWFKDAIQTL
jgi:Rad3-related DNA helicase